MPNANPSLHIPKANNIPLARVGAHIGSGMVCVGSARCFGYQHVGVVNANGSCFGPYPMQSPERSGFMFWWNTGLSPFSIHTGLGFLTLVYRATSHLQYEILGFRDNKTKLYHSEYFPRTRLYRAALPISNHADLT